MKKTFLNPESIPKPVGNYSHAIEVKGSRRRRQLFISGQIPEKFDGEAPLISKVSEKLFGTILVRL